MRGGPFHVDKAHKKGTFPTVQYILTGVESNVWCLARSGLTKPSSTKVESGKTRSRNIKSDEAPDGSSTKFVEVPGTKTSYFSIPPRKYCALVLAR